MKTQVKISIRYIANESIFVGLVKLKFGAGVDEMIPTVAW